MKGRRQHKKPTRDRINSYQEAYERKVEEYSLLDMDSLLSLKGSNRIKGTYLIALDRVITDRLSDTNEG
jgi:hypothetical protein